MKALYQGFQNDQGFKQILKQEKWNCILPGEDTELDRTVIDEIGDPIMHLLRNAADHGLEQNEERVRLGKPEVGSIKLDAYQEGNNVVISVTDDGSGINVEKVKAKSNSERNHNRGTGSINV